MFSSVLFIYFFNRNICKAMREADRTAQWVRPLTGGGDQLLIPARGDWIFPQNLFPSTCAWATYAPLHV